MASSRYTRTPLLSLRSQYGTGNAPSLIREGIKNGSISIVKQTILNGSERLDTLASFEYGDGRYWWVLAAASDIGWGMQVPPGTIINVPLLSDVLRLIG